MPFKKRESVGRSTRVAKNNVQDFFAFSTKNQLGNESLLG